MTVFHKIVNGPEPKENCPALCFLSQGRRGICNIYIFFKFCSECLAMSQTTEP